MKKFKIIFNSTLFLLFAVHCSLFTVRAQIGQATMVRIVRAEDELRFEKDLQELLKSADAKIRARAALAAGRIGNETAIPFLAAMLDKDANVEVRTMAAFALGEIEKESAAEAILKSLAKKSEAEAVRVRAVEAAGKIAGANFNADKEKIAPSIVALGEAILDALEAEYAKPSRSREIVLQGLTAALRARADETDFVVARFASDKDWRIRADALNCLIRLRAKSDDLKSRYRAMIFDDDAVVRANAARAIGASEDALGFDLLLEAAATDDDLRVRVAAIRSLAALRDKRAAAPLLERAAVLVKGYNYRPKNVRVPTEQNELLEIAATLGRILPASDKKEVSQFIELFDKYSPDLSRTPEVNIAFARISPEDYLANTEDFNYLFRSRGFNDWDVISGAAQGYGELANLDDAKYKTQKQVAIAALEFVFREVKLTANNPQQKALPDILRAYANFKTAELPRILREHLKHSDVIVRATAAELLSELPASKENTDALKTAFVESLKTDIESNDAQLAILSAFVKVDKDESTSVMTLALNATDFLLRRHAANLVKNGNFDPKYRMLHDAAKNYPNLYVLAGTTVSSGSIPVKPAPEPKLGVLLNKPRDYNRAVSRRNGTVKAVLTTDKGVFTIDLLPEDAPLTVDNFVKLAKANYFNNVSVHRVVPNFVMQDGDPRGDGNGGPGWQIRCEINMLSYERGMVGMALSGKDTGGSQWFVTHSPQPHLDGGYTIFGRVSESDMKIVDSIARGDRILKIQIIEGSIAPKTPKIGKRKLKL